MVIIYSPIEKEKGQAVLLDQHTFLKTKGCARVLSVATIEAMPLLLLFDQLYTGKLERFSCKGTWMIKETLVDRIWTCENGKDDYCSTLQCTVWRHYWGKNSLVYQKLKYKQKRIKNQVQEKFIPASNIEGYEIHLLSLSYGGCEPRRLL